MIADVQRELRAVHQALAALIAAQQPPRARAVVRVVAVPAGGAGTEIVAARPDRLALVVQAITADVDLFTALTAQPAGQPAGLRLVAAGRPFTDGYPVAHRGPWYARGVTADAVVAVVEWIAENGG